MLLERLGWNSHFAAMWADLAREAGWLPARVVGQGRGLWRISGALGAGGGADDGALSGGEMDAARERRVAGPAASGVEMWAAASGKLREQASAGGDWPAVGDWVAAEIAEGGLRGIVQAVLPRRSQFVRKTPGKQIERQVIAANVDTAFVVVGLDGNFNVRRIERYLAQCWESAAPPVVLLNKADQLTTQGRFAGAIAESTGASVDRDSDDEGKDIGTEPRAENARDDVAARVAEVERIARGVPVLPLSGRTGEGMDALAAFLQPGNTVVLLGSSGVGKSTLVNRLLGSNAQATQPVRESDSRGRHTTTSRELLRLPGGAMIIDTPGLRELQLWDAADGITETFVEIDELAANCRFRNCRHQGEPGCAVRAAIADGVLDEARLESRRKLEREQEFLQRKIDPEARHDAQQNLRTMMRGVKKMYEQRKKDGGKQ